jgi:threonine/homoserine efflux transporter RhtA
MKDSTRAQGGLICIGVAILGAWFLLALLQQSYWAIALPVAIFVFFILGLTFWIGYTIATIRVEPFEEPEPAPERETVSASEQATPQSDSTP